MAADELDIEHVAPEPSIRYQALLSAIDNARGQDRMTWLISNGKRIAAIVPVDVAEAAEEAMNDLLGTHVAEDLGLRRPSDVCRPWPPNTV